MPTLPSPDQTASVALQVDADNPAAELFLLDSQLQLVARGVGSLRTRQLPGVYKIRVRLGRDSEDKLILLTTDTIESVKAPAFASAAPLDKTALTPESHVAAAEKCSKGPTASSGDGSSIFLFVRYFTPSGQPSRLQDNPARDLSLVTLDGKNLIDASNQWITGPPSDPWAACRVQLTPGTYVLEQQAAQARLSSAIVASPGWQTQVFLIRTPAGRNPELRGAVAPTGAFEMGTVLMGRGSFTSGSFDSKLTDLARIALGDERPILGDQLHDLLLQKFVNPLQGIFGAHLMLLGRDRAAARQAREVSKPAVASPEAPFDPELFNQVVSNLRQLVGPDHPDVEALSLQSSDPKLRTKGVFRSPPMLRRSWSLIVEASNDRPDILDEKLWERVMARTMTAPFLSWQTNSDDARAQFQQSIREVVDDRTRMRESPRPSAAMANNASEAVQPRALSSKPASPSADDQRRLSVDLDIPRGVLDKMLREQ